MDASRFDRLTRSLSTADSRRRVLGGLLLGALGLLGSQGVEDAAAHNPLASCKKKSGKAKKKCVKKAKAHNATHTVAAPPPPPPPPPTCTDGVKNGTETDIDCGGSCPECANGKACQGAGDCASGKCVSQVCRACADIACTTTSFCTAVGCGTCRAGGTCGD